MMSSFSNTVESDTNIGAQNYKMKVSLHNIK